MKKDYANGPGSLYRRIINPISSSSEIIQMSQPLAAIEHDRDSMTSTEAIEILKTHLGGVCLEVFQWCSIDCNFDPKTGRIVAGQEPYLVQERRGYVSPVSKRQNPNDPRTRMDICINQGRPYELAVWDMIGDGEELSPELSIAGAQCAASKDLLAVYFEGSILAEHDDRVPLNSYAVFVFDTPDDITKTAGRILVEKLVEVSHQNDGSLTRGCKHDQKDQEAAQIFKQLLADKLLTKEGREVPLHYLDSIRLVTLVHKNVVEHLGVDSSINSIKIPYTKKTRHDASRGRDQYLARLGE